MSAHPNFDGCSLECSRQNEHTKVYGDCEKGVKPEATVTLSVVLPHLDDVPSIGFETYTVEGLADLIEPALRGVRIEIGPNSLTAIEHGNVLTLTGGEIRSMALEAAHAIIHRNDPQEQT
jgi:hypothetical protein